MTISLVAMIAHQIVWCCRCLKVERIRCITGISVLATLLCILAGIYEVVALHKATWCGLFYFSDAEFGTMKFYKDGEVYFDNSSSEPDECPERVFAALSFVTAVFWAASSICSLISVQSGQYSKWEEKWNQKFEGNKEEMPAAVAVELGAVAQSSDAAAATITPLEADAVLVGDADDAPKVAEKKDKP